MTDRELSKIIGLLIENVANQFGLDLMESMDAVYQSEVVEKLTSDTPPEKRDIESLSQALYKELANAL